MELIDKRMYRMNRFKIPQKGFTLIELMVTVAIVAILAAVAIPNYSAYVRRGKAAEATSTLALLKNRMEQYYQDNKTYMDTGALNAPCSPQAGTTKYFTYDCAIQQTASQFTLTATPIANQGVDNFNFTIDESGNKTSTFDGSPSANCWLTSKVASC